MQIIKGAVCFLLVVISISRAYSQAADTILNKADSLVIKGTAATLKNNVKELKKDMGVFKLPSDSAIENKIVSTSISMVTPLADEVKKLYTGAIVKIKLLDEKGIRAKGFKGEVSYNYFNDTTGTQLGDFKNLNSTAYYDVNAGITVAGMPFDFSFKGNNGFYDFGNPSFSDFYKFNFDHEKYIESIKSKALEKIKPEAISSLVLNRISNIREKYEKKLENEIAGIKKDLQDEYSSEIKLPADVTNLSVTDLATLKSKIITSEEIENYKQSSDHLQELIKSKSAASLAGDSVFTKMTSNVKKYEALEKVYTKILKAKGEFENNKVIKKLKENLPSSPADFKSYLNDRGNLKKVLKDQASLSSIQRLFLNITRLDIGQSAMQSGDFSLQNLMNKGVNAEFQDDKRSVGFVYGSNKNTVNNWLQGGVTSATSNEFSSVTGFKFGSGYANNIQQSVSVNFFDFKTEPTVEANGPQANYLALPRRKDAVISYNAGFTIAGIHKFNIDLSKSFGAFTDNTNVDSSINKTNPFSSLFTNTGKANFAAAFDYDGELLNTEVNVSIKKVGMGYNNPGNYLLRKGETQLGLGLSKRIFQEKLSVKIRLDYRKQNFDPAKNYSYRSLSNKIQLGYKISRSSKIGITYQASSYLSEFSGKNNAYGGTSRFQCDGSYKIFVAGKKIINNTVINYQRFNFPSLSGVNYTAGSFMFTHTASVLLNTNLLSFTVMANSSDNSSYYFNTSMLNLESNYAYPLPGNIKMSSSAGYYVNDGWNRQLGIKQQLGVELFKNMSIDIEAGYRKAIQVTKPELANQLFFNSAMHYNF